MIFAPKENKKAKVKNDDATDSAADEANQILQNMQDNKDAGDCPFC